MQVWWDVAESSECEWDACIVPITHTKATQSTHTALTTAPRFAETVSTLSPFAEVLFLDDSILRWSSTETRFPKNDPSRIPSGIRRPGSWLFPRDWSIELACLRKLLCHNNLEIRIAPLEAGIGTLRTQPMNSFGGENQQKHYHAPWHSPTIIGTGIGAIVGSRWSQRHQRLNLIFQMRLRLLHGRPCEARPREK